MLNRARYKARVGRVRGTSLGPGPATTEVCFGLTIVVADPWLLLCWAHGQCIAESRLGRGMADCATAVVVAQAGDLLPRKAAGSDPSRCNFTTRQNLADPVKTT